MKIDLPLVITNATWLMCVAMGFHCLMDYGARCGPMTAAQPTWPQNSRLHLNDAPHTLLVFLHPKCPCSNATVSELALLLSRFPQLRTQILFIKPAGVSKDWEDTALWRRAAALPGAALLVDQEGRESAIFTAHTSGECFLYDEAGRLKFAGGITGSRGHEGDNQGLSRLEAALQEKEIGDTNISTNINNNKKSNNNNNNNNNNGPAASIGALNPTFGCPLKSAPPLHEAKAKCLN